MSEEYRINPCKACIARYGATDINQVNSCCVETAAAFAGESSTNALVGTNAGENCDACLNTSKEALGRSPCDFRLTKAVTWSQTPHYFPDLLYESRNKDASLAKCVSICEEQGGPLFRQCVDACKIDYDAVEAVERYTKVAETRAKTGRGITWPYSWKSTWITLGVLVLVLAIVCMFMLCSVVE
jgi:hypothetical protein